MRTQSRIWGSALVLTLLLGLAACAAEAGSPPSTPPAAPSPPSTAEPERPGAAEPEPNTPTGDIDAITAAALAAIDLAEAHVGGVAYELDGDDDEKWEIDVSVDGNDYEVEVNWAGTEVLTSESDGMVDSDDRDKLSIATVTLQEAIKLASAEASGRVDDAELERENGVVVWEVSFESDWEVRVQVQSGEIVSAKGD